MNNSTNARSPLNSAAVIAWIAGLAIAWWYLGRIGHGALAAPPLSSREAIGEWIHSRDEADIVMALLRLVAMASIIYLFVLSVIATAMRVVRFDNTAKLDQFLPDWLVTILDSSLRVGLTAALAVGAVGLPASPTDSGTELANSIGPPLSAGTAFMTPPDDVAPVPMVMAPTDAADLASSPSRGDGTALVVTPQPDNPTGVAPRLPYPEASEQSIPLALPAADPASGQPNTTRPSWVTEPGDHLWSIATETLADAGHMASPAEVDAYWRLLIDTNRGILLDPENPDLIMPGQVFELPPT